MLNRVTLIGRLGQDPEVRTTQSGQEVANFSLATSERWADAEGLKKERTEWHRIVVFGKLAGVCGQYLARGKMAAVEGKIQTRKWEDKDGAKRESTEVVASNVVFLSPAGEKAGTSQHAQTSDQPPAGDDDYPF